MKNKILAVFFIFILISYCFIGTSVYATNYDLSDYENKDLMNGSWFIYYDQSSNLIYLVTSDSTSRPYLTCYLSGGYDWSSMGKLGDYSNMGGFYKYTFNLSTNTFENKKHIDNGCLNFGDPTDKIIASGCDLYRYQSFTSFFQPTPVPSMVNIPIAKELEKVEMTQEITTTLVGLAKYLIPLLVSLLAFWKAWQILSHSLHKA